MAVRRMSVAVVLAGLLAGCGGGHSGPTGHRLTAVAQKVTPSASGSNSVSPLTTANVYARVQRAESTYSALHGTVTASETAPTEHYKLGGIFGVDLQDFGGSATSMTLSSRDSAGTLEFRVIGSDVYARSSSHPAWGKNTKPYAGAADEQELRKIVGQLAAPLDPQYYSGMLRAAPDLKQLPAVPGRSTFTGTFGLASFNDPGQRYAPMLLVYYDRQGVNYFTFSLTLDAQARPIALTLRAHSATVVVDLEARFTSYRPTKVTAPI
jgi:hypothetical protein